MENTRHNAELNQVENLNVYLGNSAVLNHVSGLFDLVVANINRNILLADMAIFREVMAPGATMILSGFYEKDVPLLVEKAENLGLRLSDKRVEAEWTCLIFHC